jgi:hypothetical protein
MWLNPKKKGSPNIRKPLYLVRIAGCGGSHCTEFDVSFPRLDLPFWIDLTHIVPVKSNCTQGCA